MNILSGVITLCCSFWMFIYIYGLNAISSAAYNSGFYFFPTTLLFLSLYFFYAEFKKNNC